MSHSQYQRPERLFNPLRNGQNAVAFTGINGVPLGGIGAGCIELAQDGRLANFCTNNNRHRNERIETMPGSFLAFAASDGEWSTLRLLQTASTLPLGITGKRLLLTEDQLSYDGLYPRASIRYDADLFPLELSLVAHGTVVPGDLLAACMPAAIFTFTVRNAGPRPVRGSLFFAWENIAGCLHGIFPEGRDDIRQIRDGDTLVGLEFRAPAGSRANQTGSHVLYLQAPDEARVSAARFNTWESNAVLCTLEDEGGFTPGDWDPVFFSESRDTGGLACTMTLQPGESREVTYVLSWFYPTYKVKEGELAGKPVGICDQGHRYANHFTDAIDVARTALARREELCAGIARWHQAVLQSSLPEWLGRMLINNLYVLSPGTLWAKDGRFALMETPFGPMMGTLDQRFYSSIGTALFFPELEAMEMSLFAATTHPDNRGRVYHDLGNLRFDNPKTGTTAKKWTDLNPKFVLMAYRNFLWMNNRDELERLWPYLVDMMAYTRAQDTDGDGLPNNEDRSTTYDDWAFFGASSYAAGLWVAALAAFREMAVILGREADWQSYAEVYALATREFESRLWDEELGYYRLFNDDRNPVFTTGVQRTEATASLANAAVDQGDVPVEAMDDHPRINRDCHDGQLAGQWYADLLGLGPLSPAAHIRGAVQQIYRRNATPSGMRKGVTPAGDESANPPSSHWWSEAGQCWPGYEVGHYAALAIHQGEVADALETVHRLYRQIHLEAGMAWNQPLRWNVDAGLTYGWGCDRYMNSPAVWYVYLALAGAALDRPRRHLALRPQLLPGLTTQHLPLFTPGNWGQLTLEDAGKQRTLRLTFEQPEPLHTLTVRADGFSKLQLGGVAVPYTITPTTYGSHAEWCVAFAEEVQVGRAGISIVLSE